jgi:hypothetical protein
MANNPCDACGRPQANIGMGGAIVCRECEPEILKEVARLRKKKKPVNAMHIARRLFKSKFSGGNYLLRDYPADLWERVRHRAVDEGCSVRELVLTALEEYLASA